MASFNKVMLMGNLTRDPELRYTPSGSAVCDFSIAINRKYSTGGQEKEEVCFVDIVVWAKQAESCGKYLQKGSAVFVEGRLRNDNWEDKDGRKRSRLRITAERVQFLSSSRNDDSKSFRSNSNQPVNNYQQSNDYNRNTRPISGNQANNQYRNESNSMPQPPPEVFDNEYESEDDIPF
ncbi:MAG TPA: single-stranded DNA-binding protein [Victivallales bacterium]|nr:single-stranded DNA-binding protein [Victivallales bacterium]